MGENNVDYGECNEDWSEIASPLLHAQPELSHRIKLTLHRPASRDCLIQTLGALSDPFTLVRSCQNCLLQDGEGGKSNTWLVADEPPQKKRRRWTVYDHPYDELTESQKEACVRLGWTEATWNASKWLWPKGTTWASLSRETQQFLLKLGESAESWDKFASTWSMKA